MKLKGLNPQVERNTGNIFWENFLGGVENFGDCMDI